MVELCSIFAPILDIMCSVRETPKNMKEVGQKSRIKSLDHGTLVSMNCFKIIRKSHSNGPAMEIPFLTTGCDDEILRCVLEKPGLHRRDTARASWGSWFQHKMEVSSRTQMNEAHEKIRSRRTIIETSGKYYSRSRFYNSTINPVRLGPGEPFGHS